MINLKTIRQMINEMAAGRAGATLMSDDQGKLYELSLAKAINNHPDVGRGDKLPRHHRSHSDNPEHAGTPGQVYDRLVKKGGKNSSEVALIKKQAKEIAPKIIDSLKESGHLGKTETNGVKHPPTKITNVFWTSNRDTEKKPGDHQLTSGIRDPKSKGDVMLTIAPQHPAGHYKEDHKAYKNGHDQGVISLVEKRRAEEKGEKYTPPENPHPKGSKAHKVWNEGFGHGQLATHVNISAKYASKAITFENAGIESIGRKLGSKDLVKKLKDESDAHDERMAKQFGYSGKTHGEIHEKKFKPDRAVYEKELHDHMKKTGTKVGFKPKSKEAKKVHAAYAAANESYKTAIGHVRKHMLNMNHKQLKDFILNSTSPETHHETLVAHSNPVTGENQVHSRATYDNFINEHKNLRVESKDTESGPTLQIVGDHPIYGKGVTVAQMGHRISHGITGARTFDFKMPSFGKKRQVKKEKLDEMILERKMNQEKIMAASERASAVNKTVSKSRQISQARAAAEIASKNEKYSRQSEKATRGYKATQRQSKEGETQTHWFDDEGNLRIGGAAYAARAAKNLNLNKHSGMLGDPRRQAELEDSDKAILAGMKQAAEKSMSEEAPANAMGTAGISGADTAVDVGIAGHDMLLTPRPLRRSPPKMFGGKRVFTVPSSDYYKATLGRKKGQHWRSMVNGPLGEEIRQYALDNKDAPIIVEDETTGAMMYLRYGKR